MNRRPVSFGNYIVGYPKRLLVWAVRSLVISVLIFGNGGKVLQSQMTAQEREDFRELRAMVLAHEHRLTAFGVKQDRLLKDVEDVGKDVDHVSKSLGWANIFSGFTAALMSLFGGIRSVAWWLKKD